MNQSVPFVPSSHDESDGGDAAGAGDIESVSAGSDVADTSAPDSTPSEARALAADEPAPSTQEISASEIEYSAPRPTGLAAAVAPPSIPLAPAKRVQAKFNPLADGMLYLVVFVGGFFGTAMRYGLSLLLPNTAAPSGLLHSFHTATFIANMLACFIFAALSTYMSQAAWIRKRIRQLVSRGVGMGMCGGFSTLSAMMIEDLNSLRAENIVGFVTYTLLSFICGLIIAWLGTMLGLALSRKREAHVVARAVRESQAAGAPSGADLAVESQAGSEPAAGRVQDMPVSDEQHLPSFEPDPITAEIPLRPDPETGEVR